MKQWVHVILQVFIFLLVYYLLDLKSAAVVTSAHFIPTIDFLMLKLGVLGGMHRRLFHNIFAAGIASLLYYQLFGPLIGLLGFLNMIFHFALDLTGRGIAIFYPLSEYRLRL
ncbi:MAG: hypothetical protein JW778_04075 [Candidatus Altiarchaeota archaeon]|nr:hypothetical protein [Candidatus Altiarchaeota archaeon]